MSIPVPSDFSCADLLVIQAKAEQMFNDDVRQADITPYAETASIVLQNQTARFVDLQDKDKDRTVKVDWIQGCDAEVVDCTSQCDVDGTEAGALCQNYALNVCKETSFSIRQDIFRTSLLSPDEVVARMLAEHLKVLDEYWAQYMVGKLISFAGVNANANPYPVIGTTTTIPAPSWNASVNGYFAATMVKNKMRNMYMLSGDNLYSVNWNAMMEQGNAEGKGNAAKMKTFPMNFDLFNIDSIAGQRTTFLINPASVAMVTKTRYTSNPIVIPGKVQQTRYTVASPSLPGVSYDVAYEVVCVADDIKFAWKITTRGGVFLNPFGCDSGRTGVLMFVCG